MNVSLRKHFFTLLLVLAVPLSAWATQDIYLETFQSVPLEFDFVSSPNDPSILIYPEDGTMDLVETTSLNYTLTYSPDADFVGEDYIELVVWNSVFLFERVKLHISVLPSKVIAVQDYVTTNVGVPVQIDVLANDSSSTGVKKLVNIPLVNSGSASFSAGEPFVNFTPDSGFEGIAYLNYVLCDDMGSCDHGTVVVNVVGPSSGVDTNRVFTKKNLSQVILVPDGFDWVDGPYNGSFDNSASIPEYTPGLDYTGVDYLTFVNGNETRVFEVIVLDVVNNTFAFDDRIYTTPYESVEYNILENDANGTEAGCVYINDPQFGSITEAQFENGLITYTPAPGFSGVDWFTYSSKEVMCQGGTEVATVYVFVGDYEPTSSKYYMSTPKRTPLIIGYDAPIFDFTFDIVEQGDLGETLFLEGQVDTTIYGQPISGYNLMVYIPNGDVDEGVDEFEVVYCVPQLNGGCSIDKSVKIEVTILNIGDGSEPMCIDDCVWPGDTNFDGVVNMEDLLPLGLCMGEVGVPRSEQPAADWYGVYADDWNDPFEASPVDLKHLDTDGDSMVTALDTMAISAYYGRTHSMNSTVIPFSENPIELQGAVFASPGDLITLDMIMGSPNNPAIDVYGFTFPFQYNPDFFVPSSVAINYNTSSWLTYNSPVLKMTRNNLEGLIESGFTRTSGLAASGEGKVGYVSFVVVDDLDGFRNDDNEIEVEIGGGVATGMNSAGETFGINIEPTTIKIILRDEEELDETNIDPALLKVFPNPVQSYLNVHLNGGFEFEQVRVFNMTGQLVHDTGPMLSRHTQIDVSNLENGMYYMTVHTGEGIINKKFEVIK